MLVDWFTVLAQIVNFFILIYLLKRFLYGPIIRAMDGREKKIALRMEEAQKRRDEAEQEAKLYREKNRDLDNRREALLAEIKEGAEASRKELMNEARSQVDAIRADWYEAIQREQEAFLHDLRRRAGKQTCAVARKALRELSNVDLERHIIKVFIERLRNLDHEELEALEESMRKSGPTVTVRSSFEIPQEIARQIEEVLQSQISDGVDLRFEISPDIICGIELNLHGRKIAWSLADYLETLEEDLLEALGGKGK